jgi:hypothetical protein
VRARFRRQLPDEDPVEPNPPRDVDLNDDVEVPGRLLEPELLVLVLREGARAVDTELDGRLEEVERCRS